MGELLRSKFKRLTQKSFFELTQIHYDFKVDIDDCTLGRSTEIALSLNVYI